MNFAAIFRPLTITKMSELLHQTKLYLVELEDNAPTAEKLQHHQQLLDFVSRSLQQNPQDITSQIVDLQTKLEKDILKRMQLTNDVQNLKEIVAQQDMKIAQLDMKITELTTRVNEAIKRHNTMILRQIARSFQHKAAKYCGVGKPGRQYCVTYKNLINSKMGDSTKKNEITELLFDRGFDETHICCFLQYLREIGTSNSHPITSYEGRTPKYDELVLIIQGLPEVGEINTTLKEDALKILEIIQVLSTRIGSTDLLESWS